MCQGSQLDARGSAVDRGEAPPAQRKPVDRVAALLRPACGQERLALRKALSERLKSGDVVVVDSLNLTSPKTKEFAGLLRTLGLDGNTNLFVVGSADQNAFLASRNVPGVELKTGALVNTYDLLKYDKLVFTKAGFEAVEARLVK